MSAAGDHQGEMSADAPFDDLDGLWLAPFAEEVRFAVSGVVPEPTPALAAVLRAGVSTDKGDLLATAASNVHGPAPQVSGLPKWRKEETRTMPIAGFLSTLLAKLAEVSTAAKAAVAGVTAAATMTVAGAAAGVLPGPAQGAVAGVVNAVSPLNIPAAGTTGPIAGALGQATDAIASSPVTVPPLPTTAANAGASVGTPAGSAAVGAGVTAPTPPPAPSSAPVAGLGGPNVANLPANLALPSCVTNLIPTGGTPDPSRLLAQLPACIQSVLGSSGLPVDVSRCVASVLSMVNGVLSPGSVGTLPRLDVSACIPFDASRCTTSMVSAVGAAGWVPFAGDMIGRMFSSFGGFVPGFATGSLPGCIPLDISRCISSVTGGLGTLPSGATGIPRLDLSACMPTGITNGLPGLPAGIPGIPGMGGGIPFWPFGR